MSQRFIPFIQAVGRGEKLKRDLSYDEAAEALRLLLAGEATEAQAGAFLIAQRVKGESADECRAFTDVVRHEILTPVPTHVTQLLDLGVPYDGKKKTAQLAPAIALTLVRMGVPVLLHGAKNVPMKYGVTPADVLEQLGYATQLTCAEVGRQLDATGFGYIDAAQYAPAWNRLTPLRQQFGLRTVFNTIEKWFNPANAPYQVSGFFHGNYIDNLRTVQTGTVASYAFQGEEGSIELAVGRRSPIYATHPDNDSQIDPQALSLGVRVKVEGSADVADHTQLNQSALQGERGPAFDQVVLTVGCILSLFAFAPSIEAGMALAVRTLTSGEAHQWST